jgi:hypothetical protein
MTAHVLSRPIGAAFRENPQTNHLAFYEWCARTGGRCDPAQYGSWSPADQAAYLSERLELAKELLRTLLVVGTAERLPVAMNLLRRRSAAYGFALLPFEEALRLNTTTIPLDDVSWIEGTELGSSLLDALALDLELFRYGEQLLTE